MSNAKVKREGSFQSFINIFDDDIKPPEARLNCDKKADDGSASKLVDPAVRHSFPITDVNLVDEISRELEQSISVRSPSATVPPPTIMLPTESRNDVLIHQQRASVEREVQTDQEEMSGSSTNSGTVPTEDANAKDCHRRLCGFLNKHKLGARGLAKIFKRRWFVMADSSCSLLYYRTPQDEKPLGEIHIANATFTFDMQSETRSNIFEIRTPEKVCCLEAEDRHTMLYWLQELQIRRRQFRQMKNAIESKDRRESTSSGNVDPKVISNGCANTESQILLDNVLLPPKTVGTSAASSRGGRLIRDLSITKWKVELHNMVTNIKNPGRHARPCIGDTSPTHEVPALPKQPDGMDKLALFRNKFARQKIFCNPDDGKSHKGCRKLQESLDNNKKEMSLVEEELSATQDLVKIMQKQIDKLILELKTQKELAGQSMAADDYLEELNQRDRAIVELEHAYGSLQKDDFIKANELSNLRAELSNAIEDLSVYKENIQSKDTLLRMMNSRIAELEQGMEQGEQVIYHDSATCTTRTLLRTVQHSDQLQDICNGFKLQNKFLNQEILELNNLLRDEESRGERCQIQLTQMEASYYQLKSKYIKCLKELTGPHMGGLETISRETVSELIKDAMESDVNGNVDSSTLVFYPRETHDQYGFELMPGINREDLTFVAENLQQRSDRIKSKRSESDISLAVKWERFLINLGDRPLPKSRDLKALLREGISPQFRPKVWKMCIDMNIGQLIQDSQPYSKLLDMIRENPGITPVAHQVELDLLRTLPNNKYFDTFESEKVLSLKNILLAFSVHNPEIGYCQGLNRLAAILLLFLNEEDAFWGLVTVVEVLMPSKYYNHTLIAAHADQRVLKELVADKLPQLYSHFTSHRFDLSLFTFSWFLTIFIDNIPVETYLRIWDTFLYEGSKVLFRYAVATMKYFEEALFSKKDCTDLNTCMRSMGESLTDIDRLSQIAFHDLNPFPMKAIHTKRQFHLQKLNIELAELDKLRHSFERSLSHHKLDRVSQSSEEEN